MPVLAWLVGGAVGAWIFSKVRAPAAPVADVDVDVPTLWTGTVGNVPWSVGRLSAVAFSWSVRVPRQGPQAPARDAEGAEPDIGAALKAAIRTAIEEAPQQSRGNIDGSASDASVKFSVRASVGAGYTWYVTATGGVSVSGQVDERGQGVLAAVDEIGKLQS